MIARIWHGRTPADKAREYVDFLRQTGIAGYKATQGNLGVYVLLKEEGAEADFLLISLWESENAIKAYAGEDIEKAVYYPEDEEYLLEFEPNVKHYEVVLGEPRSIPPSVH